MVRIVQGRYKQSMVRTVQEGTNSPRYEQSKVRIVREPPRLYISVVYSGGDVIFPEIAERKSTLRKLKNVHFEPDFYSIMIY